MLKTKIPELDFILKYAFHTSIAKFFTILVSLLSIPLALNYLGSEKYGLWILIISLTNILLLSDFGVSNSLIGISSSQFSKGNYLNFKNLYLSSLFVMGCASFLLWLFFFVNVNFFLELLRIENAEMLILAKKSFIIFITLFCLNMIFFAFQQVRLGILKDTYKNGLYNSIGQCFNLFFFYLAIKFGCNLVILTGSFILGTLLLNVISSIDLYCYYSKKSTSFDINEIIVFSKNILHNSKSFFILQISILFAYNSDNYILARYLSLSDVSQYSITFKVFSIIPMIVSLFLNALWSSYSNALNNSNWRWINRAFTYSLIISSLFSIFSSVFVCFFAKEFIDLISQSLFKNNVELIIGMACWAVLASVYGCCAVLLNGLNIMKYQVLVSIMWAFLNIFFSAYLTKKIGISGPIWGSAISLMIVCPFLLFYCYRLLKVKTWPYKKTNNYVSNFIVLKK